MKVVSDLEQVELRAEIRDLAAALKVARARGWTNTAAALASEIRVRRELLDD